MLKRLDTIGYVDTEEDDIDKRKHLYVPLMKGEEKARNPLNIDSWTDLKAKLGNSFKTWKENIPKGTVFYMYKNSTEEPIVWREQELILEEMDQLILKDSGVESAGVSRIFSDEELGSKVAKTLETNQKPVSSQNLDISEEESGKDASNPSSLDTLLDTLLVNDQDPNTCLSTKRKQPSDPVS
jgi:DNA-binding MarR family transcriptional regulator